MKHFLRYSLMCMLSILWGTTFAQTEVVFDFDNDYATLFPTLAGTSTNESHDGDFTEATTSTSVGGFTVTISAADEGVTNANRIWSSAPRLRLYSGTLTVSGSGIKKIEFTHKQGNFNLTPSTGTLTDNIWTGDANEVVFSCSKNTQINKLVINGDAEPSPSTGGSSNYGTADAPLTVAEALAIATALDEDASTSEDVYTKGVVTAITTAWSSQYNNVSFNISNDGGTTNLAVFRCKAETEDYVLAGDEVIIKGKLKNYRGNTPEYDAGCEIISLVQGEGHQGTPDPGSGGSSNYGTADAPLTVAEAIAAAIANGETASKEDYYVKGKICSIKYEYSAQYGTATYNISEDGSEGTEFTVYSSYYFDNKSWQEGDNQIAVGDEVIVCGKIINYNGNTPEFASKQNYLVALNGKTSSGTSEDPEAALNHGTADTPLTIAEAIAAAEVVGTKASADDFYVKGKISSIKYEYSAEYGTATYNISEDGSEGTEFTVYSSYYLNNKSWQEGDNQIAVGDEVIVCGKIINYNGNTPEFASKQNYLVALNKPTGIQNVKISKANGAIYNLAGQQVEKATKGIYIQNGKKFIVK